MCLKRLDGEFFGCWVTLCTRASTGRASSREDYQQLSELMSNRIVGLVISIFASSAQLGGSACVRICLAFALFPALLAQETLVPVEVNQLKPLLDFEAGPAGGVPKGWSTSPGKVSIDDKVVALGQGGRGWWKNSHAG